jgi:hypothetical protein
MTLKHSVFFAGVLYLIGIHSTTASTTPSRVLPVADGWLPILIDTLPLRDREGDFLNDPNRNPFDLSDPSNVDKKVEYDPESGRYIISERIGDEYFRAPTSMTFSEYMEWKSKEQERDYFARLAGVSTGKKGAKGLKDPLAEYSRGENLADRLFGGREVSIQPQGNIDLIFGARYQNIENPALPIQQQRQFLFDFDMDIRLNVTGQIGKKLSLATNFNSRAQFDFENQLKLKFDSEQFSEDDILKNIEAGNVSLPLRSNLIQGSQSLFGIKTELQFGHLRLTAIASQQRGRQKEITVQGGSQVQEFEVRVDEYDENRHFFLTHFNRDNYEEALQNLPQINSLFKVNRIEVWRTNIQNETERLRDVVAVADLGEPERFVVRDADEFRRDFFDPELLAIDGTTVLPDNRSNRLYEKIVNDPAALKSPTTIPTLSNKLNLETGRDFELKRAQRIRENEYTLNEQLGILTLNSPLRQEEVLAVAIEYDYNGKTYRIGQFSTEAESDSTGVIVTKMLKTATPDVRNALWDLMMKNVYSVGAYQVDPSTFNLDIYFDDPGQGFKRFLPEPGNLGRPLLQLFNLDQLNAQGDPQPDGRFDFVPGVTINTQLGKVFFPVLEPFGSSMEKALDDPATFRKYEFQELYDSTKFIAQEYQEKNRFVLRGKFESSVTSEISLGAFNIPEGSVRVSAGGAVLREGIDYEVDYSIGRLRIINDSYLASGVPISISFEDQSLFSFQNRNMMGLRADYELTDNIILGGTYMHLWERPITQKVNIGDDPINNRIIGLDASYDADAPWLTKLVDKIPGLETKVPSSISAYIEGAALIPGYSGAIDLEDDEGGSVYIDDFEGTAARIDISQPLDRWNLASIPQNDRQNNHPLFPEAELNNDRLSTVNRALINWYRLDRNIGGAQNDPYTRIVDQNEIFPNRTIQPGLNIFRPMDITFYPQRRGPYNYDVPNGTEYSSGIDEAGRLRDPETRWGGIMRGLTVNDFQASNIEYIEFWMLNPFMVTSSQTRPAQGGYLYIDLGNISEDILKDGRAAFENGLPRPGQQVALDTTNLGVVPQTVPFVNAFDNDPVVREAQDVGLDGMSDQGERDFLANYLAEVQAGVRTDVYDEILADPANDNFIHFLDDTFPNNVPTLDRYLKFNHVEGNSPNNTGNERFATSFTFLPTTEDINRDFTSDRIEGYFQYKIPIINDGSNRLQLTDFVTDSISTRGGGETWYRFVVPIQEFEKKVGAIQDFRSIRFMRMYLHGFDEKVTMRFATMDLVRNSWRRFLRSNLLSERGPSIDPPVDNTSFSVNQVGIEENSEKIPYNYVIPPGIQREQNFQAAFTNAFLNESSLAMEVCELKDGDARAVIKNDQRDLRLYERLKMFIHAESDQMLSRGEATIFIRIGSDYSRNYYEYEMPMTMSQQISTTNRRDPEVVWPEENEINFALQQLVELKNDRNAGSFPNSELYSQPSPENPEHRIKVLGNPNLGFVKGFMIGIRNTDDGGGPICLEVWTNELRATGLDNQGGMAALGRVDAQLADFGNVSFSGTWTGVGWGSIDQKLQERARHSTIQYDIATNLQLGQLLGENSPLKLPFYAQLSNTIRSPQYDPYDRDIELDDKLQGFPDRDDRDSIRRQAQDRTKITSINFTNVRYDSGGGGGGPGGGGFGGMGGGPGGRGGMRGGRGGGGSPGGGRGNPMPWSIENFSLSYAFTETDHTDPLIELDNTQNHTASLNYQFAYKPLYIEPFKKLIKNDKYLKFISEIHLNPLPNSFGFSTVVDRYINQRRYRFSNPKFSTWYDRRFSWDRTYTMSWDITRSLRFNFNATHFAMIDELDQNGVDFRGDTVGVSASEYRWNNFKSLGRPKNYDHNMVLSYNVPLRNFPFLDFIDLRAQISANYNWAAAAINVDSLGNVIQNGQQRQINATVNFERLYNKSKYFKSLNQMAGGRGGMGGRSRQRQGQQGQAGRQKQEDSGPSTIEKLLIRPLMSVRRLQFNWSENYTSSIPGFMPETQFLGLSEGFDAPGWEYIMGFQPTQDFLFDAAENKGWFTASRYLSQEVVAGVTENWNAELNIEPWNDFRIDISMDRSFNQTSTALFKNVDAPISDPYTDFMSANYGYNPRNDFGSYTISYMALNTLFTSGNQDLIGLFNRFENNRPIISTRLNPNGADHDRDPNVYKNGFGRKQQDVLIPAFIAAYSGEDPANVNLDIFNTTPRPNWTINWNGLSRISFLQPIFRNIRLSHAYSGSMTVSSFQRNAAFDPEAGFNEEVNFDEQSNLYSEFVIPEVVIDERFNPLIGIDIQTQNDIQMNFKMSRARNLALSFTDTKLFETNSFEYTFGFGYTLSNVSIGFLNFGGSSDRDRGGRGQRGNRGRNTQGKKGGGNDVGNRLTINLNFSYRDDVTFAYEIDNSSEPVPTRGTEAIQINPSVDYDVNKNITLRLFLDYNRTIPKTSLAFPITNARGGINVRFNLN